MRKRLTALLLCLCMVLTMLPVSAMAAVGDLLGNTPEQNASLLEKLESFTGGSAEEAQQLLDSLGLLDEDGNLITDQTIDLDGKQYTLEEIEALLADPSTDLTRVAQVDGVPIALQDLQTIVAIERELQYLQETYFSGRTFSGKARENLNGLLNQLQTQGMTLNATTPGNEVVLDTEGQGEVRDDYNFDHSASFISSGIGSSSVPMKEGDTFSVKFKLAIPESIQKLRGDIVVGFANHMDMTDNNMLTSVKAETITVNENMNPDTEYTLEYTVGADDGPNNGLYLYVSYQFFNLPSGNTTTIKDPLGDVYGGVSFYEPSGFLFGSGDGSKIEDYNLFFVRDIEETTLVDSWTQTGTADDPGVNAAFATFNIIKSTSTAPEDYQQLDKTLGYLQSCIDGKLSEDNAIRFQIESDLVITSSDNQSEALLSSLGLFANYNGMSVGENPYNFKVDTGFVGTSGFPIHLTVGGGTKNIKFNAFRTEEKSDAELKYLPRFIYVLYGTDDTTEDTSNVKNVYYTNTTTSNTTVTLVDPKTGNDTRPTLTITAPAGTYKSGDLVPITITGDEYIKASADATVEINDTSYKLSDLHSSTDGKFISFLYEVKEIDSATLTVQSVTGITDFFGNDAKEVSGAPIPGVELATPQMKNAVERLGVTYTDGALHFTIAAKQDKAYQNFYANNDALMQLLITVDDGAPVTHAVTVGEDTVNNGFTFTADPYTIAPTAQEQTVTVQLQVNTGTVDTPSWVTVNRVTQTVTVGALLDVTGVTATVVDDAGQIVQPGTDDKYTVAMDEMAGKTYKLQAAFEPDNATYQTGTWHSSNEAVATVSNGGEGNPEAGTIQFQSQTGEVEFWFVADNGTPENEDDDEKSNELQFVVTAGNSLILSIPPYAQDSLIQAGKDATVSWVTNVFDFYPSADVTFTVSLFAGTDATGTPIETYTVENLATTPEKITECTIPAADLPVTYPQSQYTVQVSMTSPEARSDDTGITVLSPPTEMRITADKTSITDGKTLELNYSINNASATGTLSATRMAGGKTEENADGCLSTTSNLQNNGTVTFDPVEVDGDNLYDTYTITFTEDTQAAGANFAPSTDSLVLYVYKSDALSIQSNGQDVESISLNNESKVDGAGKLPTESDDIMALRQELGLIAYVSINADAHNWSSFRDGIQWALSGDAENVAINYRQGGLWDNIEDLPYETYLPQTQMAISATADVQGVTVTATHAATGMSDTVTVDVETLQDKLYMFQATPAQVTTVTYTTGKGEARTLTTNADGLLVVYEPDSIASDVQFRSGDTTNPNLGTIAQEALSSGERDAAKLQLYPLNAITLVPAAKAELYLVQPDGTPFANQKVTLRGGVYLEDNYCGEDVRMGPDSNSLVPGNTDGTYTTDGEGKLTVHMDATQFNADGYTGPLTNAALDYWFELRDLNGNQYYPVLVNVQGSMSADRILRTGSVVVVLEEVPDGEENKPYLTAQTLSYGEEDGSGELQVRNVLDSTGKVGPNSTYKYAELTSYFTLWGVDNDKGGVTVSMTGENGYAPEGQLVKDDTFPFASIPILTNTTVLTKATMTDSGWLEPETAESLRASVYQNGELVKQVTMPFQVIDLTEVEPVNVDATAVMVDMSARFKDGIGNGDSDFSFTAGGSNSVTRAFNGNIEDMLGDIQEVTNPLFRVLITPSEDNSVFNVLIWGGYNSLNLQDFDYTQDGFSMDYQLMEPQLDFGVPSVNEIGEMAAGTYDPADTLTLNAMGGTHNNLDFGAQLEGYYEGQFYYDTDQRAWCFRAINGGFTAGAGVSFQANVNAWVGPIPITGSFGAGIALQLDYKAATVYTDQQDADTLATWTDAARQSDSVNDYLTTLRINGYIDAFGGFGFDYTIIALKIGLFGRLAGDSTNRFLSRTYLENEDDAQMDGQALGINGEVGIKFVAKFLFISYETVLGSGGITWTGNFNQWGTIDNYWGGASGGSLQRGAPTLLSRSYLEAYANGATRWNSGAAQFGGTATVVQEDANPGSEPAVNDDGSLSVYISDENSDSYFASRIRAGAVGAEGKIIDDDTDNENNGHGDMSPSLSGDSDFTVAAWIRLFEDLEDDKKEGEALSAAEQKQLLNSTEIMVATTGDNGGNWKVQQLTENASPDLAPVTASNGTSAVVFWRSAYASDPENLLNFDTQNAIYYSRYNGSMWSEPKMAYNGSIGSVVGLQASMLSDGTALAAFTVDRNPDNTVSTDYEMAYRVIGADDALGDLVVLTSDDETDTNPQAAAVSANGTGHFVLAWYSTQDGGDIRLQAVGSDGQLYSGGSNYTVPASVKAVSQEDGLVISSDFRLAKRAPGSTIDGLTLVWAETAPNGEGQADHSVLYGAQLCQAGASLYLSTPQTLITLPDRTLANSFSAWRDGSGKVSAYIFGTYYDPAKTETVPVSDGNDSTKGYKVAADTDKLLTGGGTMQAQALSVDSIVVDYANLQTNSFTPVVFTLRNTGTTVLDAATVAVGGYSASVTSLNPGDSASVTVLYKTGAAITNPTYTITTGGSPLASGTLYLDYNDIGISSMKVVEESQGKRTVLVTLYNDSAAKLAGSSRTVELRFYSDSEHSQPASVTLLGSQSGVSSSGNTITLTGSALSRLDQGSMALLVTYDLASYVTRTLQQEEVPASGVYLYANALVKESGKTMAEYAQGNNSTGVQLTGAYARTGEETTLDTALDNSGADTTADVTLQNNCLQAQPDKGTLLAVLLDENGNALETKAVTENTGLSCEETKKIQVTFGQKGSDVILLYVPANSTGLQLRFTNMNVGLSDFVEDPANPNVYTYTLPGNAPASTSVIFVSGDVVTVNGAEQGNSGSVEVAIPTGASTITVESGGKTYSLTLNRTDGTGGNPGDGGGSVTRPTYPPNILETEHGTVTVSPARPHQGDRVTITTQPDEGYKLGEITVTWPDGQKVTLTPAGDGKYTFTQPGVKVTIDVTFVPEKWPFVDVAESDWFFQAVKYVFERGIMVGTSDTTFEPQSSVTRGQVVQMLYNLEGQPAVTGEDGFTDVQSKDWWYNAVVWASQNEVVSGYGDGTFQPKRNISRQEFAQMLFNYAKFKGYDLTATGDLTKFPDGGDVAGWAETAMQWANGNELINGHADTGKLDPLGTTVRAQAASILTKFHQTFVNP